MSYKVQLLLTGKVNDVGAYTRTNVPNSYRMGVEFQAVYLFANWLNASGNVNLSKNKVKDFVEYIDNYDNGLQNAVTHSNTNIGFSPSITSAVTINILPVKNVELTLLSKYVGKQYLDNTQTEARTLSSFFTQDVRASYTLKNKLFKEIIFIGQVNNIFNRHYEPNGYTYSYISGGTVSTENAYYPMAGTNFMLGINVKF